MGAVSQRTSLGERERGAAPPATPPCRFCLQPYSAVSPSVTACHQLGQSHQQWGASHPHGHPHRGEQNPERHGQGCALLGPRPRGDASPSGWRRSSGFEAAQAWGAAQGPAGEGLAALREPCRGAWDPPGKPAKGRGAPRRPSSVNRTSRGFLLSWWSPPEANCSGGGSSELPPRPWTVTSRPWLLLSSSVQSRTWGTKPVSLQHHSPEQAPHRCPHGRCQQRGSVNQPPVTTLISRSWEAAALLRGCGTGDSGQEPAPVSPAGQRDCSGWDGAAPRGSWQSSPRRSQRPYPPHRAAGTTDRKWHRSPNSC